MKNYFFMVGGLALILLAAFLPVLVLGAIIGWESNLKTLHAITLIVAYIFYIPALFIITKKYF